MLLLSISCGGNTLDGLEELQNQPESSVNPLNMNPISGKYYHIGFQTVYGNGTTVDNLATPTTPVTCTESNYDYSPNGFHRIQLYNLTIITPTPPPGTPPYNCNLALNQPNIPYVYDKANLKLTHGSTTVDLKQEVTDYIYEKSVGPIDMDGDGTLDTMYLIYKK